MTTIATDQIAKKLDELIEATRAAALPLDSRWLDAGQVGTLLGYSGRQVMERIACRPDFPKALRLNGHGHPRWKASEVLRWADAERSRHHQQQARRRA